MCEKVGNPIKIDGVLDPKEWGGAAWTDDFVDIEGAAKPKPRFRTRVKMAWDDQYLYIAAELEEPALWATYDKHDMVIFHEHDFEVFLDPDGDGLHYFEFEMNALNTGWDLYLDKPYKNGGKADNGWEIPGLKTAVHLNGTLNDPRDTDRGWTLEIAFPWTAFNRGPRKAVPPQPGESWRINFSRVEWILDVVEGKYQKRKGLKEDNWVWSPQGVINMHVPEKWGVVKFQ
ncbi:carbohydrate-binding family 9-like protein [Bryobacter aggregatus]|uniref:carbohydrate-binding family 9-like protein n=1 Tax=Bryobacter aggregatus TaxID=360054 RepID=UPI000AC298F0|nr:carbohydrate-binding family 9-like protein [Bryobacter aggregatus]